MCPSSSSDWPGRPLPSSTRPPGPLPSRTPARLRPLRAVGSGGWQTPFFPRMCPHLEASSRPPPLVPSLGPRTPHVHWGVCGRLQPSSSNRQSRPAAGLPPPTSSPHCPGSEGGPWLPDGRRQRRERACLPALDPARAGRAPSRRGLGFDLRSTCGWGVSPGHTSPWGPWSLRPGPCGGLGMTLPPVQCPGRGGAQAGSLSKLRRGTHGARLRGRG